MQLFYSPIIYDGINSLDLEESRHCVKVLRKKEGDRIDITDGKGNIYIAELIDLNPNKCQYKVLSAKSIKKASFSIHIALAPTKNSDRIEWFIEKAVEIGVSKITFLQSAYSERNRVNLERAHKKSISAMKQSVRAYLPELNSVVKLNDLISTAFNGQKFIAHLDPESPKYLKDLAIANGSYLILIGPEGGFSHKEISITNKYGFQTVKLGNHRLRTETAGVVACNILNMINQ